MTGFAFPEILVAIHERHAAGDEAGAAAIFDRYCPLIRCEFQPRIRPGATQIRLPAARRHPQRCAAFASCMRIDGVTMAELEATVRRVGLSLDVPGAQRIA